MQLVLGLLQSLTLSGGQPRDLHNVSLSNTRYLELAGFMKIDYLTFDQLEVFHRAMQLGL